MRSGITLFCLAALLAIAASQLAVSSVHNTCQSDCPSSNTNGNCCGCCGSDSFCAGNNIEERCCPNNSAFCGCITSRGFCSGYVYGNSARVNGSDGFGTCYDFNKGSCTYNPSSSLWIVCPNTYSSCASNSAYTCCSSGETCFTNTGASFATCAFPTGGPVVTSPTSGQTLYYNTAYTFRYTPVVARDTSYNIITGGNNQAYGQGTLNQDGSVSISYTLRSFSPSNGNINLTFVEGNVSTTVQVFAAVQPTASTSSTQSTPSATAVNTNDCQPNGCAGGALCCGGQCYSTGQYQCYQRTDGSYQLCPQGLDLCGSACYNPSNYSCTNGNLGPK